MLAFVSVDIHHQNKGIGKRLIQALEREAILKGYNFISVLGWPNYYANLGYQHQVCTTFIHHMMVYQDEGF